MEQWEYIDVVVTDDLWYASTGISGRLPAIRFGDTDLFTVSSLLNDLAEEGWELAGVLHHVNANRLLLRRAKR